jgi:hypothetical protein
MHRDAVVEALWPDLRAAAATNNLHQTLHSARRALAVAGATADVLRLRDGVVTLCPEGVLATDVQDLEAALDKALAADDPDLLLDPASVMPDIPSGEHAHTHGRGRRAGGRSHGVTVGLANHRISRHRLPWWVGLSGVSRR